MKIINTEPTNSDKYTSYYIDFGITKLWVDTHKDKDGDITIEWNKYIFFDNNEQDQIDKNFQDNFDDWDSLTELINKK